MLRRIFLTLALSAISAALPFAAPTPAWQTAGADKNAQARTVAPDIAEFDKQPAQVQEKMKLMQAAWLNCQSALDLHSDIASAPCSDNCAPNQRCMAVSA